MTFEARVLDFLPDIRVAISTSKEYIAWRDSLGAIKIDGEVLYIRGGDMLKDEDQIMFEWARQNGMISDEEIAKALSSEGE